MAAPSPIGETDSSYRRKMLSWLSLTVISGAVLLTGMYLWIERLAAGLGTTTSLSQYDRVLTQAKLALCLGIIAIACALAALLLKWVRDTRSQQTWPPKGLQMAAGTPPLHGEAAERIAKRLERAVWLLCLVALAAIAWAALRLLPALF